MGRTEAVFGMAHVPLVRMLIVGNCRKSRYRRHKRWRLRSEHTVIVLRIARRDLCLLQHRLRTGMTIPDAEVPSGQQAFGGRLCGAARKCWEQ